MISQQKYVIREIARIAKEGKFILEKKWLPAFIIIETSRYGK